MKNCRSRPGETSASIVERIKRIARSVDRLLIDIGGENLDARRIGQLLGMLEEHHRDRVSFLACRAARDPNAQFVSVLLAREELRHVCFENGKGVAIAKEMGHADEEIAQKRAHLRRMLCAGTPGNAGSIRAN